MLIPGCGLFLGISEFEIAGTVYDRETGEPKPGVTFCFYDISVDDQRAPHRAELGVTDASGRIDKSFDYWWCSTIYSTLVRWPNRRAFAIELNCGDVQPETMITRFRHTLGETRTKDGVYRIDIGDVYL